MAVQEALELEERVQVVEIRADHAEGGFGFEEFPEGRGVAKVVAEVGWGGGPVCEVVRADCSGEVSKGW